jgi:hypothetical protein
LGTIAAARDDDTRPAAPRRASRTAMTTNTTGAQAITSNLTPGISQPQTIPSPAGGLNRP